MESVLRKVVWLFREQPVLAYGFCGCLSAAAVTWTFLKLTTSNELQLSLDTESSNSELQRRVNEAWLQAQRNGALQPLSASAAVVNESDMPFLLTTLDSKAETTKRGGPTTTPSPSSAGRVDAFASLPARQVIASLDRSHKLLFNRYYVTPKHLVAITTTFQPQDAPLSASDMRVAWALVNGHEGVAFYNGGFLSGASQPRRHLQFIAYKDLHESMEGSVRAALSSSGVSVPLDAAVASYRASREWSGPEAGEAFQVPALPYVHTMWLHGCDLNRTDLTSAAATLHARYSSALAQYHRAPGASPSPWDGSHNLLLTPSYMMLVPRAQEHALSGQRVSINALGYLGMVLCRPEEKSELLGLGLMRALSVCGWARK